MTTMLETSFMRGFIRMAGDSWDRGWHERNGGNLSYRIPEEQIEPLFGELRYGEWQDAGVEVPALANEFFVITAAGSYFRNIAEDPERCLGIIQVDETGTAWRACWGFADGGRPTSELPAHLMVHEVRKLVSGGLDRVVCHAHPENIIALTFVLPLESGAFTRALWAMISECVMVFPDGVGVLNWGMPGSTGLAVATADLMERTHAVVWAHHGLMCAGATFDETFGLMHTIEKASAILVKVMSMGHPEQFIGEDEIAYMAQELDLHLSVPGA